MLQSIIHKGIALALQRHMKLQVTGQCEQQSCVVLSTFCYSRMYSPALLAASD